MNPFFTYVLFSVKKHTWFIFLWVPAFLLFNKFSTAIVFNVQDLYIFPCNTQFMFFVLVWRLCEPNFTCFTFLNKNMKKQMAFE